MSFSEEDLTKLYEEWKQRVKSADVYMGDKQLKVSLEGMESFYPYSKDRGPLGTLAYVTALLYETCGVREIRIHDTEEVN